MKKVPVLVTLSNVLYPYQDRLRVWWRTNRRLRAYPKDFFERLFETRPDPWQYAGDHQQERFDLLLSVVPESTPVLEIGCAEGTFTRLLAGKCKRVMAVDLSITALQRAKSRIDQSEAVAFAQADLLNLPFRLTFPTIVCAGVLVYFAEGKLFEQAAGQICRVLSPEGVLILENMWERSGGSIQGQFIHEYFSSLPDLELIHMVRRSEYVISVFQKRTAPVPAAQSI